MSNSYKITKHDTEKNHLFVDFSVNGTTVKERFDGRYVPLSDATALDDFLTRQLSGLVTGAQIEEETAVLPKEVSALVGKKQEVSDEKIAETEELKAKEVEAINSKKEEVDESAEGIETDIEEKEEIPA